MLGYLDRAPDTEILHLSHLRGSSAWHYGHRAHKEWLHFCVLGGDMELLVNFSLSDGSGPDMAGSLQQARLTVLARSGTWDGDIETFPMGNVFAPPGRLDVRFGANGVRFGDGAFQVHVALRERRVAADLVLVPVTRPIRAPQVPLLDGPPLRWVIVPRLAAHGTVTVGSRVHSLGGDPAYHDHNWGRFHWGQDFAWLWGFALAEGQ